MERTGRQNTRLSYSAVDIDSGVEVLGIELRQGLMKPEDAKKDECILKKFALELLGSGKGK